MRDRTAKHYGDVIQMWAAGFNTAEIAKHLNMPEHQVERWVRTYTEATRKVDRTIQEGGYHA